jgi:hypothetical protein
LEKSKQEVARQRLEHGKPVGEIMAIAGLSREAVLAFKA